MSGFLANTNLSANAIEIARRNTAGYIDLTSSNPTHQGLFFPADVLRAAAEPYWSQRRYEPDAKGTAEARAAIARYYNRRLALTPNPSPSERQSKNGRGESEYLITASTSEAYGLLFTLLTEPGDNIIGPDITYPLFEHLAEAHHVDLRTYKLDESRGWQMDEASLLAAADDRTRGVLIVSPHNPTGTIVQRALPALDQLDVPVICDEVFAEFTYRAAHTPLLAALHPALPVFTLNGISKLFALPDLKLGWIALNAPATRDYGERLEILNDAFLSANSLTQFMLPALFAQGMGFVDGMRTRIRSSLDMALEILATCPALRVQPPDGGYYLFPRVLGWDDDEEALVLHLLKHGALAHPGFFYGCEDGAHLMISCLTEPERLREGLNRLVNALG